MKTYRVKATSVQEFYVDVEANDEVEAWSIARDLDGSDFTPIGDGDWQISDADPQIVKKQV
jgi:hypothetical protein